MLELAVVLQVLTLVGLLALLGRGLRSYVDEKGKNLATRQDIKRITRLVEEVKDEYAQQRQAQEHTNQLVLAQGEQRHQLSLAAIDKRLAVHQEAFARAHRLQPMAHRTVDVGETSLVQASVDAFNEMTGWWLNNCLYLEPAASEAFIRAVNAASSHKGILKVPGAGPKADENWDRILAAPKIIAAAVKLPGVGAAYEEVLAQAKEEARLPAGESATQKQLKSEGPKGLGESKKKREAE
jgi:hypothetical protein